MSARRDLSPREAVERWLDRRRPDVTESTLSSLWYRLKLFVEWCEERDLDSMADLDGWLVDEYQLERNRKAETITLEKELGTLKQWLEYCHAIELVPETVPAAVEPPKANKHERSSDELLEPERGEKLVAWYRQSDQRATRAHVVVEILWSVGCRVGGLRSLDLRDFDHDERVLEFRHRPETGTELKQGVDGERDVGLTPAVADVIAEYTDSEDGDRLDMVDEYGRAPLLPSREGRPTTGTMRNWCYFATVPCLHDPCPHGHERPGCEYLSYLTSPGCPSSCSPHQVRTGSITWQLSRGSPVEAVGARVNSSADTIEDHYDKESLRRELEERRRDHLDNLEIHDGNEPVIDDDEE